MNRDITTIQELNMVIEEFVRYTFDDIIRNGAGSIYDCLKIDGFADKKLNKFIYHMVLETVDCDKITYKKINVRTIYVSVRRTMLEFTKMIMCVEETDEVVIGTIEENLLGYYVYAYLHEKLNTKE